MAISRDPPRRLLSSAPLHLGRALREALAEGYGLVQLRQDVQAGLVVGIVALPLSMALAIAVGLPPQHGLYTAIVAGAVIALLGGSRVQISGPTAAFVVILAPIVERHGPGGLLMATVLAGLLLVVLGWAGLGRFVEYVPYPVTAGFTAGIAISLATGQLRDLLGLEVTQWPEGWLGRIAALARSLPTAEPVEVGFGLATLVVLVGWGRWGRRIPAPLVALGGASVTAWLLARLPGVTVETVGTRFHYVVDGVVRSGVPSLPPLPRWPWTAGGADGAVLEVSWPLVRELLPAALAIAMLGAIESLLSAVVADGMIRRRHDPNVELVAQGVGNVVAPFFGGIAATGAIARTATNVRAGGRSPVAALVHCGFLLAATVLLAPLLAWLPMASLAALLLVVAWNMSEARHVLRSLRSGPRGDAVVLSVCLGLTVLFDMVIAVGVGVVLASLLFLRRMAELADVSLSPAGPGGEIDLPRGVVLYRVEGPLFFGAAQRAMRALHSVDPEVRLVVLDLREVPTVDGTAMVNLTSAIERLHHAGIGVILAGVQRRTLRELLQGGIRQLRPRVELLRSFDRALERARARVAAGD